MLALVGVSLRVIEYMCFHILSIIRKLVVGFTIPTPLAIHVHSEIVLASTSKVAERKKLLGKRNMPKESIFFALLVILFYYSVWISFIILPDSEKYNWHSRAANFSNQITLPRTIV